MIRFFVVVLAIVAFAASGFSQTVVQRNPDLEKPFSAAVELFRNGKLDEAAKSFATLAELEPAHQYSSACCVMAAKAYNSTAHPDRAYSYLDRFFTAFPDSRYQIDATYERGVSEMLLHRYVDATLDFDKVRHSGATTQTSERASGLIDYIAGQRLLPSDLAAFRGDSVRQNIGAEVSLSIARRLYKEGRFTDARTIIDSVVEARQGTSIAAAAMELRDQIAQGVNLHIGVVLPLNANEPNSAGVQGNDMLDGIRFALNKNKSSMPAGMSVVLDIHDSGKEPDRAKALVTDLAAKKEVVAVIGPMFSSGVIASAPVATPDSLPLISPTANAVGMASSGPFVFQLNPDLGMHGRAMARYAAQKAGLKSVAILSSTDPGLKPLVESFYNEVKALGGKVIAVEFYDNAADDLDKNCVHLRKVGVGGEAKINFGKLNRDQALGLKKRGISPELVDELRRKKSEMGLLELLGPFGVLVADTLHISVVYPSVNVRDVSKPLQGFDAVYVPISQSDNIPVILSQFAYYNIDVRILGNAEWNNPAALELNKHAAQGVTFCSESFVDKDDAAIQKFGNEYYQAMQKSPNRYAMFGYDAMQLVLRQIDAGNITRTKIANGLQSVQNYRGLHSSMSIGKSRVNPTLNIIRYSGSELKRVHEISGE